MLIAFVNTFRAAPALARLRPARSFPSLPCHHVHSFIFCTSRASRSKASTRCVFFVPRARFGESQLIASATAVGVALVIALGVGVALVRRATGAFVPGKTA